MSSSGTGDRGVKRCAAVLCALAEGAGGMKTGSVTRSRIAPAEVQNAGPAAEAGKNE